MMKYTCALFLIFVLSTLCKGQDKTDRPEGDSNSKSKDVISSHGPNSITRTIKQDRNGNIWMASWEGVFRYDGKSFTNVTTGVSSARFFSILEDDKGNLWFGSIGSGVYNYDGKSLASRQAGFQNFTTKDGLLNNEIVCIHEDVMGNIWFGANGGVSRYDGKSYRNFMINGNIMDEVRSGKTFPDFTRPPNEVNSIIEDKNGKLWFATRGNTFVYDGKTFSVFTHNGQPFTNVRWIIEDKKGNIWLGGNDGLWRYDGSMFNKITQNFTGYIYEDKKGNIWTSSEESPRGSWALSRYDEKSLSNKMPTATIIKSNEGMIFGILEANDGSIWFGTGKGVSRYDGNIITNFKSKDGLK